jgi:hypothetical protein
MIKPTIGGRESDVARDTSYMNQTKSNFPKNFETIGGRESDVAR